METSDCYILAGLPEKALHIHRYYLEQLRGSAKSTEVDDLIAEVEGWIKDIERKRELQHMKGLSNESYRTVRDKDPGVCYSILALDASVDGIEI